MEVATLGLLREDDDVERTPVMIRNEVSIRSLLEPVSVNDASRILRLHRNRFEFIACLYCYLYSNTSFEIYPFEILHFFFFFYRELFDINPIDCTLFFVFAIR